MRVSILLALVALWCVPAHAANPKASKATIKARAAAEREAKAAKKAGKQTDDMPARDNPQLGDSGRLRFPLRVQTVVDADNMIVDTTWNTIAVNRGGNTPSSVRIRQESVDVTLWVKGYPTKGIADGSIIETGDKVFKASDTKQYQTVAGGSKTVFVLEPMPEPSK